MTVKELKEAIAELPDDMEVILQKDGEGNGYSPLSGADPNAVYIPNNVWPMVETLTDEILRMTEIKREYDAIPAGALTAALMGQALDNARKAQASGDILQMTRAFRELREFEL